MSCKVSYESPDGEVTLERELSEPLILGRSPGDEGIILLPEDPTISSKAIRLETNDGILIVKNTSTYSELDIQHDKGIRFLFPGEELRTASSVVIVLRGQTYTHTINVTLEGSQQTKTSDGNTISLMPSDLQIPEERFPTMVALCASKFFPDRYGTALLNASEIAKALNRLGHNVSSKAINHKIQRTKDELSTSTGSFLDTRDDLAEFLVRNSLITREDVENLLH